MNVDSHRSPHPCYGLGRARVRSARRSVAVLLAAIALLWPAACKSRSATTATSTRPPTRPPSPVRVTSASLEPSVLAPSETPTSSPFPTATEVEPPLPTLPPTPTFTPWFPYRVFTRGSKLGVHALSPRGVVELNRELLVGGAYFPVVKAVDDIGWLRGIKEVSPGTITLARVTGPGENITDDELRAADLRSLAERVMGHLADAVAEHGDYVDFWEPTNELDPPGPALYARFAELHIHMMDIAEAEGYKIGLFTFNVGTPEWDEMVAIADTGVFGRARQGGHILTLHEGVFGDVPIDHLWGEQIPGAPVVDGAGALCFRYRYLYHLLEQRREVIPLVVSEFVFGAGYEAEGVSAEEVDARRRWYDNRLRRDYYAWAFLPFTLGAYANTWEQASYEYAYPEMIERSLDIRDKENDLPEAP